MVDKIYFLGPKEAKLIDPNNAIQDEMREVILNLLEIYSHRWPWYDIIFEVIDKDGNKIWGINIMEEDVNA